MVRCICATLPHRHDCPMAGDPAASRAAQQEAGNRDFDEHYQTVRLHDDQSVDVYLMRTGSNPTDPLHNVATLHFVHNSATFIQHDLTRDALRKLARFLHDYAGRMDDE